MQFVFQSTGIPYYHNIDLLNAAKELGHEVKDIGYIPVEQTIVGLDQLDPSIPTFFYVSTTVLEMLSQDCIWSKYIHFNDQFDTDKLWTGMYMTKPRRNDLLNEEPWFGKFKDLKDQVYEPVFVRPISSLKIFPGTVLKPENLDDWLQNYGHGIDPETEIAISEYTDIWAEWRFFVINGEVITGSQYKLNGRLENRPADRDLLMIAHAAVTQWLPLPNCVMDLALTKEGLKVVEFNCIHSSGLYDCNAKKIVTAIAELYET